MLAERLSGFAGQHDVVVLGLPRGGVPVAFAIAEKLQVPLDILPVRKLGVPGNEEFAMGAIAGEGVCVLRPEVIAGLDIAPEAIEEIAHRELRELKRREQAYRPGPPVPLQNRVVILVDDGLATGATMQAAVKAARHAHPAQVIVAVPVSAKQSVAELRADVDQVVCLHMPEWFGAVSQFYDDFAQVGDAEVTRFLRQAADWNVTTEAAAPPPAADPHGKRAHARPA